MRHKSNRDRKSRNETANNSESDSDKRSIADSDNESDPDIKIIKDIINENDLTQKKHGSNNNPTISFQYDISELINAIK